MKLVPSGHRRRLREQRGAQRRQPVDGPAEEEEGVFGQATVNAAPVPAAPPAAQPQHAVN
jgi:hypothetical protein